MEQNTAIKTRKSWGDYLGIVGASACLVHCMATPLLLSLTSSLVNDVMFQILFIGLALLAIVKSTKHTHLLGIKALLWVSFAVFSVSIIFEEQFHWMHYVGYAGSTAMIIGHLLNIRLCNLKHQH